MPTTYFAWGDLTLTGSINPDGISFFSLRNVSILSNGVNLGTQTDQYYGRWAETSGPGPYPNASGSYPNDFNRKARDDARGGIGAWGTVTDPHAKASLNTRSFGSNSCPFVVADYDSYTKPPGAPSTCASTQRIAFPFQVPDPAQDSQQIDVLRERALQLEQITGTTHYLDSIPGNGQDDAGLSNGARTISSWPSGSTYSTVVFYKFATYDSSNNVNYNPPSAQAPCGAEDSPAPTGAARGVIVVENGDITWSGNRGFYGAAISRPYDSSGNLLTTADENFRAEGEVCLRGYANAGGDMYLAGDIDFGSAPELGSLAPFTGDTEMVSWRELYQ
jgi:hypothetical protein